MRGNRPAMVLYAVGICYAIAVNVNGILFPFFVPYIVEQEATAFVLGGYIAMGAMGVPFWTWLSGRIEKRPVLAAAMALQTTMMSAIFFFVGKDDLVLFTACIWIAGMAFGSIPALMYSIISDVLDYEQLRSGGFRDEGKFIGLLDVARKLCSAIGSAVSFALIDWSGYQPNVVPQTDEVKFVIRLCYALGPAIMAWIAVFLMLFLYPLDRQRHREIVADLAALSLTACCKEQNSSAQDPMAGQKVDGASDQALGPESTEVDSHAAGCDSAEEVGALTTVMQQAVDATTNETVIAV
jgi:GPH family glycoside/pentoside/hexuronide:cation symporter